MFDVVLSRRKALLAALSVGLATRAERALAATPRYALVRSWGGVGTATGRFDGPRGVAVASNRVYVADSYNNRIQEFTGTGSFTRAWGRFGTGSGQLNRPRGLAVSSAGQVIVADTLNHRIQIFTPSGGFVRRFGSRGTATGRFADPFRPADRVPADCRRTPRRVRRV
jgi:DNA-binding beta-propeller fold protein YncE